MRSKTEIASGPARISTVALALTRGSLNCRPPCSAVRCRLPLVGARRRRRMPWMIWCCSTPYPNQRLSTRCRTDTEWIRSRQSEPASRAHLRRACMHARPYDSHAHPLQLLLLRFAPLRSIRTSPRCSSPSTRSRSVLHGDGQRGAAAGEAEPASAASMQASNLRTVARASPMPQFARGKSRVRSRTEAKRRAPLLTVSARCFALRRSDDRLPVHGRSHP